MTELCSFSQQGTASRVGQLWPAGVGTATGPVAGPVGRRYGHRQTGAAF